MLFKCMFTSLVTPPQCNVLSHYWHEICSNSVQTTYYSLSLTVNIQLIVGVTFGSVIAITIFTVFVIAMSSVYSRKRRLSFNK